MFKKSRIKIVASIMSILVVLWVGMLGGIYASSYIELSKQNRQMLKTHAEMYDISKPANEFPPDRPINGMEHGKKPEFHVG